VPCGRLGYSKLLEVPLIISGGDHAAVASCSYEARTFGVQPPLPIGKSNESWHGAVFQVILWKKSQHQYPGSTGSDKF